MYVPDLVQPRSSDWGRGACSHLALEVTTADQAEQEEQGTIGILRDCLEALFGVLSLSQNAPQYTAEWVGLPFYLLAEANPISMQRIEGKVV